MAKNQTFAVVDLETTGTKMDGTNRIIQFSCVLVQNRKIVNTFNTLINPLMAIPADVQNLTGIHEKDVRHAPLFDDVAGTIYALLQDTVFVAHNIQFDYRFLNAELERVGYPELDLKGVDTVQLSQILYPCLASYRLQDLSAALKISHERPHQADSDAVVTAELLIKLMDQIHQLPDSLLRQLESMGDALLFETGMLFSNELRNRNAPKKYDVDLIQVGKITFRRPRKFSDHLQGRSKQPLLEAWPSSYEKRPQQLNLMEDVASQMRHGQPQAFFEAPTGTGKTLGYLLPAAHELQYGHRFLISTTTNALQNQLIDQEINQLDQFLPFKVNVVSLKGSQHYIDLDKFAHTLDQPQNDYTRLIQMRLLVWLTQTETGDLDELNFTVQQLPLFDEITHHGVQGLNQESPYYQYDFMRRRTDEMQNADFVITNHAYLIKHAAEFADQHRTLIVDEAQQLVTTTLQNNNQVMDLDAVKILADTLLVKMESQVSYSFANLIEQRLLTKAEYRKILQKIQVIDHTIPEFRDAMLQRFMKLQRIAKITETPIQFKKIFGFVKEHVNQYRKVQNAIRFLENKNPKLYRHFIELLDQQRLDSQSFNLFKAYFKLSNELLAKLKKWDRLALENLEKTADSLLMWLSYPQAQDGAHLRLHFGLMESQDFLQTNVYSFFNQVLFFSGSYFTSQTYQYFVDQLGAVESKHFKYQSAFDYEHQAKALLVKDAPDVNQVPADEYANYLSDQIIQICQAQHRQTMVLFNSNEMVEKVYDQLRDDERMQPWQILAQNVTGTAERLKKKFQSVQNVPQLLLATGTFWEGVDLPADQLETLVIAKLPFQAIQSPYNQIRYQRDERAGGNAFNDIALPEAVMRFAQGVGRLIRTQHDRGLVITPDSRIVNRSYGKQFVNTFPQGMPVKVIESEQLTAEITNFFNSKR